MQPKSWETIRLLTYFLLFLSLPARKTGAIQGGPDRRSENVAGPSTQSTSSSTHGQSGSSSAAPRSSNKVPKWFQTGELACDHMKRFLVTNLFYWLLWHCYIAQHISWQQCSQKSYSFGIALCRNPVGQEKQKSGYGGYGKSIKARLKSFKLRLKWLKFRLDWLVFWLKWLKFKLEWPKFILKWLNFMLKWLKFRLTWLVFWLKWLTFKPEWLKFRLKLENWLNALEIELVSAKESDEQLRMLVQS